MLNDHYLGHYSNIPEIKNVTQNEEDFGLDVYEPLFFRSPHEWTAFGTFSIKLKFDVNDADYDLFYFVSVSPYRYRLKIAVIVVDVRTGASHISVRLLTPKCHAHEWLVGRIKLTKNGIPLNDLDSPTLGFEYDQPSEFDQECGTFGLGQFQLPHPNCPAHFVCGAAASDDRTLQRFSSCLDAMNCHMVAGMTTGTKAKSEKALFLQQMIPHHQNAVNMAKALLKTEKVKCEDLSDDESPDCIFEG